MIDFGDWREKTLFGAVLNEASAKFVGGLLQLVPGGDTLPDPGAVTPLEIEHFINQRLELLEARYRVRVELDPIDRSRLVVTPYRYVR